MMRFDDDEPIGDQAVPDIEGRESEPIKSGKVTLAYIRKDEATLDQTDFKVMVKLTGTADTNDRAPLDLVAVLDVSGSMNDDGKLTKLKTAMPFVIKKLGPCDRLSIVTFNKDAEKKVGLRRMTGNAPADIEKLVTNLTASEATNIIGGLDLGKQVLDGRKYKEGRQPAIILLSDGQDNVNRDSNGVLKVPIPTSEGPVYTFGFGKDQDSKLLNDIAVGSRGGTFATVEDGQPLTEHFSQCLAGLVTTVVQDLELTLTPEAAKSEIVNVEAGKYQQSKNSANGSVTIQLGTLCSKETRKVIVNLRLSQAKRRGRSNILGVKYTHRDEKANPITVNIQRAKIATPMPEKEEIMQEQDRVRTVGEVRKAVDMADRKDLEGARDMVDAAQNKLHDAVYEPDKLMELLKYELKVLLESMISAEEYKNKGRHFALSFLNSHESQRFASRGDVKKIRSFATPRMDEYLVQATEFNKDPTKPPPTVEADEKKELAADPFAPITGPLNYHHQAAIEALKQSEGILDEVKTSKDLISILDNVDKAVQFLQQLQRAAFQFLVGHLKNSIQKNP